MDLTPTDIAVSRSRGVCSITWPTGQVTDLALETLRGQCPCAQCRDRRDKLAGNPLALITGPTPSAELLAVEPVGGYAVRFQWADGHSSGIYSYGYLAELAGLA